LRPRQPPQLALTMTSYRMGTVVVVVALTGGVVGAVVAGTGGAVTVTVTVLLSPWVA